MLAPAIASLIFTLAGTGASATAPDTGLAARADLLPNASVAPLADGTFLIGDGNFVRHVDARGTQRAIAGSGYEGTSGDGGPATAAHLTVSGLAALPGGGYLIADGDAGRVRMVDTNGVISTVAGGGRSRADGVPATQAQLEGPDAVAVAPGGGFVIGDGNGGVVRRVGPDGLIHTIAGNGETESPIPKLTGQPATSVAIDASDVAVEAGGSVLIADAYASRVDRVSPSGAIAVAAADVSAYGVGALPDGGFLVADNGIAIDGANARIWRYEPDGARTLLAGTGRFVSIAPTGLEHRGDGGSARDADLGFLRDVKPAPDGGVLFTEGTDSLLRDDGARVRYLAPAQPGILAAAIVRDRVFTPGKPSTLSVTTSLPATLTIGGTSTAVPAGSTRVPLRALSARPHAITAMATDAAGRRAVNRVRVFPRGYLPDETARLVATGIAFSALGEPRSIAGDGVLGCRRAGARRVDCSLTATGRRCQVVAAISLAAGRLRWGTYGCGFTSHPRYRRRPRALRKGDWSCDDLDFSCPPPLFGTLKDQALVPAS